MKTSEMRVVMTGATGGIGHAASWSLLRAGASVLVVGRDPRKLVEQKATFESQGFGSKVDWVAADLSNADDLANLSESAIDWDCNAVVHGAGLPCFGRFTDTSPLTMAQALVLNLLAPMQLTQMLLPHLMSQSSARVLCIGSALGRLGIPGYSVYSASKFGLRGFCESLRRELTGTSVKVQYLGPRSTRTTFNTSDAEAFNRATGTQSDSVDVVAAALLDLLMTGKAERFIGFPERLAVCINGAVPALLDGAFAKHRKALPGANL